MEGQNEVARLPEVCGENCRLLRVGKVRMGVVKSE